MSWSVYAAVMEFDGPTRVCVGVTHHVLRMIAFAVLSLEATPGWVPQGGSHTTQMSVNVQAGPLR